MPHSGSRHTKVTLRDALELTDLSDILKRLAAGPGASRAELARLTGRSRSSVTQRAETLLETGLVVEAGLAPSSGGRKGHLLRIDPALGLILSADLGATQARLAVSDFTGTELATATEDLVIDQEPDQVLGRASDLLADLLTQAGHKEQEALMLVVGIPGPVEFGTGTVVKPPLMPRWDGYSVRGYFAGRYPLGTLVDNDVNLMALGEHRKVHPSLDHLLFVKVGTGIGCGIVINGQVYRGADGAAGDIGHIRIPHGDALCQCGNLGCLEAMAGGHALAQRLAASRPDTRTARDVAALAATGDPHARQEIRQAAQHIGGVLAALVSFSNPSAIILGGSLAQSDEALLAGIRSGIYDRALPLATRSLPIETSKLKDRAGTEGAIALAQQHALSAEGITALLRAHPPKRSSRGNGTLLGTNRRAGSASR
jgi:predicted NBD/HSP70 family sugar kinase